MFEKLIKDYFSFSRKERVAVIVLVALIIIISMLPRFFPSHENQITQENLNQLKAKVGELKPGGKEDLKGDEESIMSYRTQKSGLLVETRAPAKAMLFYFDPNKLSGDGWKKLGLSDRTISTIGNYISKGGRFRKKEDIAKIYGLHAGDAERLMPFVKIEETTAANFFSKEENKERYHPYSALKDKPDFKSTRISQVIDINKADSSEFIDLPGIGTKLANRILRFREKLGGFYSVDQISEVYGLPDSVFQRIRPALTVANPKISLININNVEADQLRQHPYIKWNIAAAIIAYRKQHGEYKTLDDLKHLDLITGEIFSKIAPYLSIE